MSFEKKALLIISLLLLVINIYVISEYTFSENRILRFISVFVYFLLFLYFKGYKNKAILFIFVSFLISAFFMLFYDDRIYNKLTSLFSIAGYLVLLISGLKRLQLKKVNKFLIAFFVVIIFLNFFFLDQLLTFITYKLHDGLQQIILYFYGIVLILACVFAGNYNFTANTTKAMYYMSFVFGFALSDFFMVLAYYFNINLLFIPGISFYLFALFFMVRYAIDDYSEEYVGLDD
ncbi:MULTISPECIES: hypothetical protein [unclassified Lacinutrix]